MGKQYANRLRDIINDPQLIIFYAKANCKKCFGRGFQSYSHPTQGEYKRLCGCVEKNVRKETDELEKAIAETEPESVGPNVEVGSRGKNTASRTPILGRRNDGDGSRHQDT